MEASTEKGRKEDGGRDKKEEIKIGQRLLEKEREKQKDENQKKIKHDQNVKKL